jgi:hypothetical protein
MVVDRLFQSWESKHDIRFDRIKKKTKEGLVREGTTSIANLISQFSSRAHVVLVVVDYSPS